MPGRFVRGRRFPGAHNTGPRTPLVAATLNGPSRVQSIADGQVIEGLDLPVGAYVYVNHNNVTVRNCRVLADGQLYAVHTATGKTGTALEYCELGATTHQAQLLPFGGSSPVTYVRGCNIHHVTDGGRGGSAVVYEYNWVHDLREVLYQGSPTHNDGFQIAGGSGMVVRGCTIDVPKDISACVFAKGDFGAISDVLIEDCYLNGGGYTVHISQVGSGVTGVTIRNNVFGPDFLFNRFSDRTNVTVIGNVDYLGAAVA